MSQCYIADKSLKFQMSDRHVEKRLAGSFAFRGQRLIFTSSSFSPFFLLLAHEKWTHSLRSQADIRCAVEASIAERLYSHPRQLPGLAESRCGTRYLIETGMNRYSDGMRMWLPGDGGTDGLKRRSEPYRKHQVRLCSRRSFGGLENCAALSPGQA